MLSQQEALQLLRGVILPAFGQIEIAEQGRERIADVVREGGDEVGVLLEGLLLLLGMAGLALKRKQA